MAASKVQIETCETAHIAQDISNSMLRQKRVSFWQNLRRYNLEQIGRGI